MNISLSTAQVIASAMGSVPNVPKGDRMGLRVSLRHLSYNTLFGPTIGLLNLRAGDFPNSVLYDKCRKITRKPIRSPLGTLGTDPIV